MSLHLPVIRGVSWFRARLGGKKAGRGEPSRALEGRDGLLCYHLPVRPDVFASCSPAQDRLFFRFR